MKTIIATDIASRGLDFSYVTLIVNYDFPDSPMAYTHRSGRTARMGRKGIAITFFGRQDLSELKTVIRNNNITPVWLSDEPDLENVRTPKKSKHHYGRNKKRTNHHRGKRRPAKRRE